MMPAAYIHFPLLFVLLVVLLPAGSAQEKKSPKRPVAQKPAADTELARLRADVIEKMKESRARSEQLLALHEQEHERLTKEYEKRRDLYHQGLIAGSELVETQVALAYASSRVAEVKRWILEDDIALTEATLRDELLRLPALGAGGYSESGGLIRFNGTGAWSLADVPKIEKFFSQTFGRVLPISAYGQTATHERLRFDHRDAVDVALHPDSPEGRSLIGYLRRSGIPFIAFRNAVTGASTGAHIHIGKPSLRHASNGDHRAGCCKP
jgi:hypothetical protein